MGRADVGNGTEAAIEWYGRLVLSHRFASEGTQIIKAQHPEASERVRRLESESVTKRPVSNSGPGQFFQPIRFRRSLDADCRSNAGRYDWNGGGQSLTRMVKEEAAGDALKDGSDATAIHFHKIVRY